ncbi:MAG: IPT/TIG domain-containing protein [Planctomycetota bacterium]
MKRFLGLAAAQVLVLALAPSVATAQTTTRVSVASGGGQGNGSSLSPSLSADGRYVAFWSDATNLVPGDTNGCHDVFVRDCIAGMTARVSVDSTGVQGNGLSGYPTISADGRYVVFESDATNLISTDSNNTRDIFVRDRQSATTTRVSVTSAGTQATNSSSWCSISGDGRYVSFASWANNLVSGDTNLLGDIFVHDRQIGQTTRVSVDSIGTQADDYSAGWSALSANGRYIAFGSAATNLVAGDTNASWDIFWHDRIAGTTDRVSVTSGEVQSNGSSFTSPLSVSNDGRYVGFRSDATNLFAGDANGLDDVFVRDRQQGTTECVSVNTGGAQGNASSGTQGISSSPDGRYVAFWSWTGNLAPGDTNGAQDIFLRDRQLGTTERVSVAADGTQGNGDCKWAALSADGRYIAFASVASNLVASDTNATFDIFLRDRGITGPPVITTVDPNVGNVLGSTLGQDIVTIRGSGFTPGHMVLFGNVSPPTTYVSPSEIRIDATPSAPGNQFQSVDVTIQTPNGLFVARNAFSYSRFGLGMQGSNGEPIIRVLGKPSIQGASNCLIQIDNGPSNGIAILCFDAIPAALPSGTFQAWPVAGSFGNGIHHNVFPIPMSGAGIQSRVLPLLDSYSWVVSFILPGGHPSWPLLQSVLKFVSLAPYYGIIVHTDANGRAQVSLADMLPWMGGAVGAARYVGRPLYVQWYALDSASVHAYPFIQYGTYTAVAAVVVGAIITVATGGAIPAIVVPLLGYVTPAIIKLSMARIASIMISAGTTILGLPGEAALAFNVFRSPHVDTIITYFVQQQVEDFSGSQGIRLMLQR